MSYDEGAMSGGLNLWALALAPAMFNVFVSYRREDSDDVTGRICDRLVAEFGRETVFQDVDAIPMGVDFRQYLHDAVSNCDVLLAIIGMEWLDIRGEEGGRRIDDDGDFVRIEIEAALQRDIPVIPVLVRGASMPRAAQLPTSLQKLAYRNGTLVRPDPDFHNDMNRLIRGLRELVSDSDLTDSDQLWYYTHGDQEAGPVSFVELQLLAADGKLARHDFVWNEGMPDWIEACQQEGLFFASATLSRMAVASLVFGLLGISVLFCVGSIAAVVLGHIALRKIGKSRGTIPGRRMAITGLVLGYVGLAATAVIGILWLL